MKQKQTLFEEQQEGGGTAGLDSFAYELDCVGGILDSVADAIG